mgnify:CR=1 FL=1
MKTRKRMKRRLWSLLLAAVLLVGMLPLTPLLPTMNVSAEAYPALTNLVEGTEITYGYVYFFYKNGKVDQRLVSLNLEKCRNNKNLLEYYSSTTNLQRVVSYDNGILSYWTRTENDFLDLSGLEGRSLTLVMFDNLELSALYAPGVNLKLLLTDGAYVTFRHSTRYKNKTAYCPQNGVTGAVIDLAQSEGSLNGCGTFELIGNGKLSIFTKNSPKKTSPDYAIVAKNTSVLEDTELGISCGNSHRNVNTLIQTITFTIDTTKSVTLNIANPKFNAAPWGCHMNNFKILNAKSLDVSADRGAGVLIFHGNNGESDPVKMFKHYRSIGKIGSEWNISGGTNSVDHYVLTLNHGNDNPRIRYSLNLKEVKGGTVIRDLEAGLGYEMSAEILYMPQWMQKLKDAGRIEFYFFGRLSNPGVQVGYEAAYLYDFYVDRIGKHGIEFYWVCKSATDPDNDTFRFTDLLKDYELTNRGPLYSTRTCFDVMMTEKVGGTRYIYNVKLLQAGGEFTEATSATHKISMHQDTLAKCYHNPSWLGIPSKWKYSSIDDAYIMEFCIQPRHGYEFSQSSVLSSKGITLNVQHTEVTEKRLVKFESIPEYVADLRISLVAKRRLTDVRGTLKNFRLGVDTWFTEIISNEPKKYTFKDTVVYDPAYGSYGVEAGKLGKDDMCYVYFDVEPGFGYYLPENASVKVILPAGYRANGIFDTAETYSTVYKGDWYSYSDILRKYRTSRLLEPNSEGKEYGTNILIQEPKAGDRPAAFADYEKPTSLPNNMKVLSMQWRKTDNANTPMKKYDKFEVGESYILDLRIGFEGGEEMGYVYPKNWKEFKVNGKSLNQWMEYDDNTNGHFLRVYESYKVVDPNAGGTLSGTVKSFNSTTDPVTVQLFKSGSSSAAYSTSVRGNSASYTISGVASGTYTMKVSKKNHVTRAYSVTVTTGTKTQNAQIHLLGDINGDGKISTADVLKANFHAKRVSLLTGYEFLCADVNGDGKISTADVNKINSHVKKVNLLW